MSDYELSYSKEFVDVIEFVYGEGFLSQGGFALLDAMLEGVDLNGKKILDIGAGLGGLDTYLAQNYNVDIVGVDVEPFIIEEAKKRLAKIQDKLKGSVKFVLEKPADYLKQFDSQSFDLVISKETILHVPVEDKVTYFEQVFRVLKPGGKIVILDWMHRSLNYSKELQDMIESDGIAYNLITHKEYVDVLHKAGFRNIDFVDMTKQTIKFCEEDCIKIVEQKDAFVQQFGLQMYEESFASWMAQKNVFQNGELLTGIFRAEK